jgi:DNA-binding protein HU-beta
MEIVMLPARKAAVSKQAALAAEMAAKKAAPPKRAAPPAKKSAPATVAPQVTITLKQIAAELAEGHDLPKKVAEAVLGELVTIAIHHLKKGDKVRLTGLGILQVRARPARMSQPGYRRIHQDRGQQKDRLPTGEGTEGGGVA